MIEFRKEIGSVVETTIAIAGEVVVVLLLTTAEVENMAISMVIGEQRGEVGLQPSSKAEIITAGEGTTENLRS
jgi:hypothetical protein